jgi:hypothetical protein
MRPSYTFLEKKWDKKIRIVGVWGCGVGLWGLWRGLDWVKKLNSLCSVGFYKTQHATAREARV